MAWVKKRLDEELLAENRRLHRVLEQVRREYVTQRQMRMAADATAERIERQARAIEEDLGVTQMERDVARREVEVLRARLANRHD